MKKILITGSNSYIGTSFEKYMSKWPEKYQIDTIDMKDKNWEEKSFSGYDVVFHVAGIAHSDDGKISAEKEKLYYSVNTDLTAKTAKKARNDGVKQFIFMSSCIVYGESAPIGKNKIITKETVVSPANCYGDSKVQAENKIRELDNKDFKVCILRPPMIYGKNSKGNYSKLAKLARKTCIFPDIENQRSMLYIENLCEFIRLMIDNKESGLYFPQNKEYVCTSDMVKLIAKTCGGGIYSTKIFNIFIKILSKKINLVNKVFGNFVYDKSLSKYKQDYWVVDFEESIRRTEK